MVVFPRFFTTCSSRASVLLSRYGRRRSSELPSEAAPYKPSQIREYVELKDQRYKTGGQVPYASGGSSLISTTTHVDSNGIQSLDSIDGDGDEECGQIRKTVHLSQNTSHV